MGYPRIYNKQPPVILCGEDAVVYTAAKQRISDLRLACYNYALTSLS